MNEISHKTTELISRATPARTLEKGADTKGPEYRRLTQLRIAFWIVAGITGFMQIWLKDYIIWGDTLSYLDSGDLLWRGDFANGITPLWSPGLPFLLGLALKILHPSGLWEVAVVKLVDLIIFLFAMASFDFFVNQFCRYHENRAASEYLETELVTPKLALATVGYLLFIWAVTQVLPAWVTTPDILVMGFVFLILGQLIRIKMGAAGYLSFSILGAELGLGYWAKAPMFPLAFIFLCAAFLLVGDIRKAAPRVMLSLGVFTLIAAPLVIELSTMTDSLTFGKSGAWNYARGVDGIGLPYHWQGQPPGSGIPLHPTRVLLQTPTVYEFGSPVLGTFPPWRDPYYWFAGITPHFDRAGQLSVLKENGGTFKELISRVNRSFIYGFLILLCMSRNVRLVIRTMGRQWFLLIPCAVAIAMFSVVHVEGRFLAPYFIVIGLALFACVAAERTRLSLRLVSSVVTLSVVFFTASSLRPMKAGALSFVRSLHKNEILGRSEPWQVSSVAVSDALEADGLRRGDRVAYIGESDDFYWARLAGLQVNAEIRQFDTSDFLNFPAWNSVLAGLKNSVDIYWATPPGSKATVDSILRAAGSKAIVTDAFPAGAVADGWRRVPGTAYYIHLLPDHIEGDSYIPASTPSVSGN